MRSRRDWLLAAALVLALVLGAGCGLSTNVETGATTPTASTDASKAPLTAEAAAALDQLSTLLVKGRAPLTGYARDKFGPAWEDVDHNGCDTRNDILKRDLTSVVFQAGSACVVARGSLADPYTGKTIDFVRGERTSNAVQIDHVVALADAWQKGAFQWPDARRLQFANDPEELLAVDGPTNEKKGDGDAATWLPPNKPFRCKYIETQVAVKAKYGLWVTQAEHDAMARILNGCTVSP